MYSDKRCAQESPKEMAKVIITSALEEKINKVFRGESVEVLKLLLTLEENPKKGKEIGSVGGVIIKEIRYKNCRFYFITDGFKVKFLQNDELQELIIKCVNMSNKKNQQTIIDKIKDGLRKIGFDGF